MAPKKKDRGKGDSFSLKRVVSHCIHTLAVKRKQIKRKFSINSILVCVLGDLPNSNRNTKNLSDNIHQIGWSTIILGPHDSREIDDSLGVVKRRLKLAPTLWYSVLLSCDVTVYPSGQLQYSTVRRERQPVQTETAE